MNNLDTSWNFVALEGMQKQLFDLQEDRKKKDDELKNLSEIINNTVQENLKIKKQNQELNLRLEKLVAENNEQKAQILRIDGQHTDYLDTILNFKQSTKRKRKKISVSNQNLSG